MWCIDFVSGIRPHQCGTALHPWISGPTSNHQGPMHGHDQLNTVMSMTGGCESGSPHGHGSRALLDL